MKKYHCILLVIIKNEFYDIVHICEWDKSCWTNHNEHKKNGLKWAISKNKLISLAVYMHHVRN